jgi:hypothetical protein
MLRPFIHGRLNGVALTDANGHSVSVQESSLSTHAALWVGLDQVSARRTSGRALLTQRQVRELLPLLQHFAEHGRLPELEHGCLPGDSPPV